MTVYLEQIGIANEVGPARRAFGGARASIPGVTQQAGSGWRPAAGDGPSMAP
jgi:hypothetical protein